MIVVGGKKRSKRAKRHWGSTASRIKRMLSLMCIFNRHGVIMTLTLDDYTYINHNILEMHT